MGIDRAMEFSGISWQFKLGQLSRRRLAQVGK